MKNLFDKFLMAFFVAAAAGAIIPGVATSIRQIFNKFACLFAGKSVCPLSPEMGTMEGNGWVMLACGIVAVFFLVVIVIRRKKYSDQ